MQKKMIKQYIKLKLFEKKSILCIHRQREIRRNISIVSKRYNLNNQLSITDKRNWNRKFKKLCQTFPELEEVALEFYRSNIKVIRNQKLEKDDIVMICVVKNDCEKLKKSISHHRRLGISKFIILDNDSDDKSVEWLLKQKDVILLQTKDEYTTNRREAWINRIIANYGYNRWYLILDSDEFLIFNKCEFYNIYDLTNILFKNKVYRARALMLDMYAESDYYLKGNLVDFVDKCIYFDKDTYEIKSRVYIDLICGGPRKRIFNQNPWLTKYPLVYFKKEDLQCKSHFLFPFKKNINTECNLILKHYKFMPGELKKIKQVVQRENYYNGSEQYKSYLCYFENHEKLDFMCDISVEYINSSSIDIIPIYKKINWCRK